MKNNVKKDKNKYSFKSFTCKGCMKSIPTKIETTNEITQHLLLSSPNSSPKLLKINIKAMIYNIKFITPPPTFNCSKNC